MQKKCRKGMVEIMNLVIVESPTKARTLGRFLGKEFNIMASMGHVRDLPKKKLAVDVKHNFKPEYVLIPAKKEVIEKLKKGAKKAKQIILATDPDREGEAIAHHVTVVCSNSQFPIPNSQFLRITFHEITKSAVQQALKSPGKIDLKLVHAQQARRILDRLVGYKLSPLLWRKVRRGLSAGRVQSVALRLIVEREKEIDKFKKKEYWTIETKLKAKSSKLKADFLTSLYSKNGKKYEKRIILDLFAGQYKYQVSSIKYQREVKKIERDLKKQDFIVDKIEEKETKRTPPPPFTTSLLQQKAHNRFGFSGKKTMMLAQKLYEEGYITYHRTDSFALASRAINQMRRYIKDNFGQEYCEEKPRVYKTRSKVAQEAHEAIRPTNVKVVASSQQPAASTRRLATGNRQPATGKDERRLYALIWKRAVATQMAAARLAQTRLQVKAGPYLLRASGLRTLFEGFLKLYGGRMKEKFLPKLNKGDKLKLVDVLPNQSFTSPPPRYNEASLVKTLESKGIGRPSTYAPIISLLQARNYVEKKEGSFWPTPIGEAINRFLVKEFTEIVKIPFTAQMEEDLDAIARGERKWVPILKEFYTPFEKKLKKVAEKARRVKIEAEKTGRKCPKCKKGEVVIRTGRFGKFLSCSRFPDCDWKDDYKEKVPKVKCPKCGAAVIIRKTRKGRQFYGCECWPKCQWASWRRPA